MMMHKRHSATAMLLAFGLCGAGVLLPLTAQVSRAQTAQPQAPKAEEKPTRQAEWERRVREQERELNQYRSEITQLRSELSNLRTEIGALRTNITDQKNEVNDLRRELQRLQNRQTLVRPYSFRYSPTPNNSRGFVYPNPPIAPSLPPNARPFPFNDQTYYWLPLETPDSPPQPGK